MRRTVLAVLAFAGLSLHCSVNQASKEKRPVATQTTIRLELLPKTARFAQDSEVNLSLRLYNAGANDCWVNRRLLVNTVHAPAPFREVWLDVQGPDGKARPFTCKVRAGNARAEHYQVLRPGEEVRGEVHLSECFDLTQPGTYVITAHFLDSNEAPPPPPQGARPVRETIDSSAARIDIGAKTAG